MRGTRLALATSSTSPARPSGTVFSILARGTVGLAVAPEVRIGGIRPGMNGITADPVLAELDGRRFGHDPYGTFRGIVAHVHERLADDAGDG